METAGVKTSPEVTTPHLLGGVDVSGWPTASRKAATEMLGTYGPPQEVTDHLLIWRYNSPWKRTVV